METLFFESWSSLGRTLLAGAVAYVALVALLRVSGKRTLAKMNAFDLVVTIALGSTLASLFTSRSLAILDGVLALALLVGFQYLVATAVRRWRVVEKVVKSRPRAVFRDGEFDEDAMASERLTRDEIFAAIRQRGIADLAEVRLVVLETDGSMSVLHETAAPAARSSLGPVVGGPPPAGATRDGDG